MCLLTYLNTKTSYCDIYKERDREITNIPVVILRCKNLTVQICFCIGIDKAIWMDSCAAGSGGHCLLCYSPNTMNTCISAIVFCIYNCICVVLILVSIDQVCTVYFVTHLILWPPVPDSCLKISLPKCHLMSELWSWLGLQNIATGTCLGLFTYLFFFSDIQYVIICEIEI